MRLTDVAMGWDQGPDVLSAGSGLVGRWDCHFWLWVRHVGPLRGCIHRGAGYGNRLAVPSMVAVVTGTTRAGLGSTVATDRSLREIWGPNAVGFQGLMWGYLPPKWRGRPLCPRHWIWAHSLPGVACCCLLLARNGGPHQTLPRSCKPNS